MSRRVMERTLIESLRERVRSRSLPRHVAIIMDGNGRWAEARGLPRIAGHREGSESVRAVTREARRVGLEALTLYAFSAQNWARPPDEVAALMELLAEFLDSERAEIMENAIRLGADLLSDETRKERRNLNIVAVLGLLVVSLDLVPTKITALGIDFGQADQDALLWAILAFDAAFFALFSVYALSDLAEARERFQEVEDHTAQLDAQLPERRTYILERLEAAPGASPEEHQKLADEILLQAAKLERVRMRRREIALLRNLGFLRFFVDFVVPIALEIASAVALLSMIW